MCNNCGISVSVTEKEEVMGVINRTTDFYYINIRIRYKRLTYLKGPSLNGNLQ